MKFVKVLLYFILLPIYAPLIMFSFTYGSGHDSEPGWYQELWESHSIFARFLALLLSPLYLISMGILYLTFELWEELLEGGHH